MTYAQFHAIFNFPMLLALGIAASIWGLATELLTPLTILSVIVVAFTFPWDNWAVMQRIWGFPNDRIMMRVGYLPVEEVTFFVLQTMIVGTFTAIMISYRDEVVRPPADFSLLSIVAMVTIIAVWIGGYRVAKRSRENVRSRTYAVHLFYWFAPVLLLQWTFGRLILSTYLTEIFVSTVVFGLYYTCADIIAVRRGIWYFDSRQITGHLILRILPWEEVAFFFLTSLLVAQSMVLLMS